MHGVVCLCICIVKQVGYKYVVYSGLAGIVVVFCFYFYPRLLNLILLLCVQVKLKVCFVVLDTQSRPCFSLGAGCFTFVSY